MSNLHKSLTDAQIHVPKGFATAANDTKLTKDSTGALAWVANSGGGGGVTKIVAGTGVTISPAGGTGDVTINSTGSSSNFVSQNIKAWGSLEFGTEFGLGNAQYNSEHKFVTNLGASPITTITPKNMVNSSVWANPKSGSTLKNFNGWVFGATGQIFTLSLLRAKLQCPIPAEYPSTIPVCRVATTTLNLTGNNTPVCFDISEFETCEGWDEELQTNEVLILTGYFADGKSAIFTLNCNILLGW